MDLCLSLAFLFRLYVKKIINKPEDWQGFERLCKKLFGELWGCPHTIRMHGRNGQAQSGVDIYCVPKNESEYYGIQCKGKDDYTNAQLTEDEILAEIEKAKGFEPQLKVFVIATSANKDVHVEKFIRLQNIKSKQTNSFEIIYYAWQDLVDLIESSRETFQWYVAEQQFVDKYDVLVSLNDQENPIIHPQYIHLIKTYKYAPKRDYIEIAYNNILEQHHPTNRMILGKRRYKNPQFNFAWCQINIAIENTGSIVIEDWKLILQLEREMIKELSEDYQGDEDKTSIPALLPLDIIKMQIANRTVFINNESSSLTCKPLAAALIQKDKKHFSFWLRPASHEVTYINISWRLLARDFSRDGVIKLNVQPQITQQIKQIPVEYSATIKSDEETYEERVDNKNS